MVLRRLIGAAVCAAVASALAGALLAQAAVAPPRQNTQPPRLVVIVVVDQMRADYIDRYQHQWSAGLRRLIDGGAVFTRAAYPYGGTMTCPGHVTISTGTFPVTHRIPANQWYDARANGLVSCMHDSSAAPVAFGGGNGREFSGPHNLQRRTLADELRRQSRREPSIISVALKPRSAIALAGRGSSSTIAVWEEDDGTWATSTAYTKTPWPAVDEYVKANPIADAYGQVWNRVRPLELYVGVDDGPGEASPAPWGPTFPHPLVSESGKPDAAFVTAWERSPWSDAYVASLGLALAEKIGIGKMAGGTDLLALSFPSTDNAGHQFGPASHEVQDTLMRLDAQLGRLLDQLDTQVGPDHYVVALTSDHGVATLPEQMAPPGAAGRIDAAALRTAVEQTLTRALGPGKYVGGQTTANLYLAPGVADRLRARPGLIPSLKSALLATGGVGRVYWADELTGSIVTADPFLDAWRLSYVIGRSGDFIIVPKRGWILQKDGTTHGSPYEYDQRVPILFYGAGVRAGRYASTATPADIAPTLAALAGIRMTQAEGWVLRDALVK
jgi:predicted AlkP superfamily pyrophosphatase or phosphodiesterase